MAARYIDQKRLLNTFFELVRINSPSYDEREIGALLARRLEEAGCRVEIQDYGKSFNLLAFKKGTVPDSAPLLLSGHMDTIEPTIGITFSVENDVIKTTGDTVLGADDKSALAAVLEALSVLKENDIPHGDIEVVFSSAEEKGLVGAKNLDFKRLQSRHAIVLDSGGGVGGIVIASPTHITYEMRVTGKPAHAGIEPEKGISAIRVASKIIAAVPDGRIDAETTANIGIIRGGTATNVVPKEVIINGELRSHDPEVLERTKETIFRTAEKIVSEERALLYISEEEEYRAFRLDEKEPFLRFLDNVYSKCGIEPVHTVTGGGSDASIFNRHGIRAVNISTGMQNVHSTSEFILKKDLFDSCLVVLQAIIDFSLYANK